MLPSAQHQHMPLPSTLAIQVCSVAPSLDPKLGRQQEGCETGPNGTLSHPAWTPISKQHPNPIVVAATHGLSPCLPPLRGLDSAEPNVMTARMFLHSSSSQSHEL